MTNTLSRHGPIIIVGAPRSGTTLLQYMLRSHPRISIPTGESHFIIPLYRKADHFGAIQNIESVRQVLEEMYRISPEFLDTDLHGIEFDIANLAAELSTHGCDSVPKIISGLFEKNARGEGKERWGDKTPYYVLHMMKILEWFPNAQFIHIIRDGRDSALSMLKRKRDLCVYNIYHAAKYWQQYVETGQRVGADLGAKTYMEVKYEELIVDPHREVQRICSFLGEAYSDSVVNYEKSTIAGMTPLLQEPIRANNTQKWKERMTNNQITIFESAAGPTLKHNNYQLMKPEKMLPLPVRIGFRLHNRIATYIDRKLRRK